MSAHNITFGVQPVINEQFRRAMEPSAQKMLAQKALLEQAISRVVWQGDHSPGSIFQLRLHQNQFELESRLVRRTLEQQATVWKDAAFDLVAKDYAESIDKLYVQVGNLALTLLRDRETKLHLPQIKAHDQQYKTSNDEALLVLSGLQKLRMESIFAPVHLTSNASIDTLRNLAYAVWFTFENIVMKKDYLPSRVLELNLLQNQFEIEAKKVRLTIQHTRAPTADAAQMAVTLYMNITNGLYDHITQKALELFSKTNSALSFDLATLIVSRLHNMRMEVS